MGRGCPATHGLMPSSSLSDATAQGSEMFFYPHETHVSSPGHVPSPDAAGSPGQKAQCHVLDYGYPQHPTSADTVLSSPGVALIWTPKKDKKPVGSQVTAGLT